MKPLKLAGLIALILWMAWITLEIRNIHLLALETCGGVFAGPNPLHKSMPDNCPDLTFTDLPPSSEKQPNPSQP